MVYTVLSEKLPAYRADFHTEAEADEHAFYVAILTGRTTSVVSQ